MTDHELTLYHYRSCPFCVKVHNFLAANDVEIPLKDIQLDPAARRELLEAGGKTQVPALMIDGQVLYESNDIIAWVQRHMLQPA